jgi:hypothetical protein
MRGVNLAEELVLKDKDTTLSAGLWRSIKAEERVFMVLVKEKFSIISCF